MRKILLLLFMVVAYNNLFALVSQGHWRWRNDDGSETAATWMSDQDQTATINDVSKNIRLRIELYNGDDNDSYDPKDDVLQYALDGTDAWFNISTTAGTNAFVLAGTSTFVTDLQATTQQITGMGLAFQTGRILVSTDKIPTNNLPTNTETEYEYVIKPTSAIVANTTYKFRVFETNATDGLANPTLKTAAVLPVTFTGFSLQLENKGVKLNWSTGTEINNDHFNVERSRDGNAWQTIKVIAAGTKPGEHTYEAFDASPLEGKNYYRIVQYDKDGRSSATGVKDIMVQLKQLFSAVVSPNPVVQDINLAVKNYSGVLQARLVNGSGQPVIQQLITVSNGSANQTLHLSSRPAPGIYMLQLKGEGINETIRIMIQ